MDDALSYRETSLEPAALQTTVQVLMPTTTQLQHMIMGMQTVWVFGNSSSILSKFPTQPVSPSSQSCMPEMLGLARNGS
jgi:hypothetical protein